VELDDPAVEPGRAQTAIRLAVEAMDRRNERELRVEHILLGILRSGDRRVAWLFDMLALDVERLAEAAESSSIREHRPA
jgi:ATP-dependent Clp protease ATP-binding subunit ClpA